MQQTPGCKIQPQALSYMNIFVELSPEGCCNLDFPIQIVLSWR